MPTYFKPLRRKIGVITLLMTCAFAAGWVRSMNYQNGIWFGTGPNTVEAFSSVDSQIAWIRRYDDPRWMSLGVQRSPFNSEDYRGTTFFFSDPEINWRSRLWGFGIGECRDKMTGDIVRHDFVIPYWFIVIPLTLLSAYLLLSKPRQSTQKPITEPIPEKMA